jgi:nucleoside 2-deoxyribosyltransferase
MMNIYIASSFNNQHAVELLTEKLREKGHTVSSFVENSFDASKGVPFEEWIKSENADYSFSYDITAIFTADLVIYISPSGKDTAVQLGFAWANSVPIFGLYAKGEDFGLMRKVVLKWFDRYPDLLKAIDETLSERVQK